MKINYHGESIRCSPIATGGSYQDDFGVGDLSISSRNEDGHAIDLGNVYFAEPTDEQRLDADTTPIFSARGIRATMVNRRLSRVQADYICTIIVQALNAHLNGEIPSDLEILALSKATDKTDQVNPKSLADGGD